MSRRASSSHLRIHRNGPRWAPITGIAPHLLQSTTSSQKKSFPKETCTRHRCSSGFANALPRSIGRAQHTPPAHDTKIRLNRSPPANPYSPTPLRWISTHAKTIITYPTQTHASISTIQHGLNRSLRSSGKKIGYVGSSHQ